MHGQDTAAIRSDAVQKKPPEPDPHRHVAGHAVSWDSGRCLLDLQDADDGRLWFGQCVEGWLIFRAILRHADGYWSPAPMDDHSPEALRWIECEGHCSGPSSPRPRPTKAQLRAAKHDVAAVNAQLERVAHTRVPATRAFGRPLYPSSETVADAAIVRVRDSRGRPRGWSPAPEGVMERSERVRERRDSARALPEQASVDLWARGMAEGDPALLARAAEQAPADPPSRRPPVPFWLRLARRGRARK